MTAVLGGLPPALLAAAVAVFLGLFGVVLALAGPVFRRQGATRSHAVEKYVHPQPGDTPTASTSSGIADGIVAFGDKVMSGRESTPRLMARLQRADLAIRAGEWWVLRLVAVVVLFILLVFGGLFAMLAQSYAPHG